MTGQKDRQKAAQSRAPRARKAAQTPTKISYRWDLVEDRLSWEPGAAGFLGIPSVTPLRRADAYTRRLTADGTPLAQAILFSNGTDDGFGVPYRAIFGFTRPDGTLLWLEDTGRWFAGRNGRPARAQGILRKAVEAPSQQATGHDADVMTVLTRDIDRMRQHGQAAALFAFAPVEPNAEAGADELRALRSVARMGDTMGLVGHMAILLARSCPPDRAAEAGERIAAHLARETGQSMRHATVKLPHEASHALVALQKAERRLMGPRDESDPLSRALHALNTRTLVMARQPIVAAGTRAPIFFEALARLNERHNALESMEDLIAALDAHGSITLLDHRMLSLAIDALDAEPTLHLSINVAPRSLANADWFRYAELRLSRRPDLARRIIFEITEQADLAVLTHARARLLALRQWGAKIAIDDFGMGRTSLRHLAASHIDMIKIAGPFVQNCGHAIEDRRFVGAMIDLAHQLDMTIVAEWVEDEAVARFLEERGVDFMQGRLFGAPVVAKTQTRVRATERRSRLG